jgi:hypothetical protein
VNENSHLDKIVPLYIVNVNRYMAFEDVVFVAFAQEMVLGGK